MERNTGSIMLIWKPRNSQPKYKHGGRGDSAILPVVALTFWLSCVSVGAQTQPAQDVDELIKKGDLSLGHHKYKEAADTFRDAIRVQPDSARAHTKLGSVLAANEDYDTAVLEEQTASKLDPKYFLPHVILG